MDDRGIHRPKFLNLAKHSNFTKIVEDTQKTKEMATKCKIFRHLVIFPVHVFCVIFLFSSFFVVVIF